MTYRVIFKIGYYASYFDFYTAEEAGAFAATALQHMVSSKDTEKSAYVTIQVAKSFDDED